MPSQHFSMCGGVWIRATIQTQVKLNINKIDRLYRFRICIFLSVVFAFVQWWLESEWLQFQFLRPCAISVMVGLWLKDVIIATDLSN